MIPSQMSLFVTVSEHGGFSSAARALGISSVAVSKNIAQLEKKLGVRLFNRTTHKFNLTEQGKRLFDKIEPHLSSIENAIEEVTSDQSTPSGLLRINLAEAFGREVVLPLLAEFTEQYPELVLDIVFDDKILDPIEEGFDLSIGNLIDEDRRIIARPVFPLQVGLYASPQYLRKYPPITSIDDLQAHKAVIYKQQNSNKKVSWRLVDADGQIVTLQPKGQIIVSNIDAARSAAECGFGITAMGTWQGERCVRNNELQAILPQHWPESKPVWLYYPSKDYLPQRTRLLIDFLTLEFSNLKL